MRNRAHEYLKEKGETVADWDGICGELADAIIGPNDDILYVEGDIPWRFHMVALIDGLVHDAWCAGDALPPREWLVKMFGDDAEIELSLNGDTIYTGPAAGYVHNRLGLDGLGHHISSQDVLDAFP